MEIECTLLDDDSSSLFISDRNIRPLPILLLSENKIKTRTQVLLDVSFGVVVLQRDQSHSLLTLLEVLFLVSIPITMDSNSHLGSFLLN